MGQEKIPAGAGILWALIAQHSEPILVAITKNPHLKWGFCGR